MLKQQAELWVRARALLVLSCSVVCVVACAWSPASAAAAPPPCGGIQLDDGQVKTGRPLPAVAEFKGDDLVCAKALAAALQARPRLRSVTIAARVPSDRRADGAAIAAAWTKVVIAAGVPEARISSIVPTSAPGTKAEISVAFREPTKRAVALVQALTGEVKTGEAPSDLTPAIKGTTLAVGAHVQTGAAAVARLALADGSFVALQPSTLIRLGRIELTRDLKRAVQIDLLRGKVEAIAEPRGPGSSFDVVTKTAVAGVRGTVFRVGVEEGGDTAVETVSGAVELKGSGGTQQAVRIEAGRAAKVGNDGTPTPPRPLLAAPTVTGPFKGPVNRDVVLRLEAVAGAVRYRVEIGGDGELATNSVVVELKQPQWTPPATLAAGHWFWRVTAVDAAGFVGLPSRTYSFVLGGP